MIRATRSRSTERQRDRETERADLIICFARETIPNLRFSPACYAFRVTCMASQSKLRLASLDGAILELLGSDFGRFWEAKMNAKIDFLDDFFEVIFERNFGIDFDWIFGGSKLEKSRKTIVFPMVFAKFRKSDVFEKVAKKR